MLSDSIWSVSERVVLSRSAFVVVLKRVGVLGNEAVFGKWSECVGVCSSVFKFGQTFGHISHVIFQFQQTLLKKLSFMKLSVISLFLKSLIF